LPSRFAAVDPLTAQHKRLRLARTGGLPKEKEPKGAEASTARFWGMRAQRTREDETREGVERVSRGCKGRFTWPQSGDAQGKVILSHEELSLLLGGIDLA
jgi:hypothetical protein